jgi:dihydrofolate reductase
VARQEKANINLIAALSSSTRAIGRNGSLLWHIPADLKRFKALTSGHPVIMGRKTWESLPEAFRPLPHRTNIIVTRNPEYQAEGAQITTSLEEAYGIAASADGSDEIFVIGGGELYAAALPDASRLYLTLVNDDREGDAHFPSYDAFTPIETEHHTHGGLPYSFVTFSRQ